MRLHLKEGEYFGRGLKTTDNELFKFSMTTYEPGSILEKHYYENNYLSILTRGNYLERYDNQEKLILAGDILFRPAAYDHQNIFKNAGGTCFNIEFKSDWVDRAGIKLQLPARFEHFKAGSFPSLYQLLINFQQQHNEEFFSEFIYDWMFQLGQPISIRGSQPWIAKLVRILENEYDQFHSLKSLSERVFVHPVYLARAFKEKKGITIGEYQLKVKLANAISLLLNTSLSISDISFSNGFYDDAHFIRSFKAVYKMPPHQFRLLTKI